MDRNRLKSWLESPHRTFRWNRDDYGEYEGVQTGDDGLRWFRWSHNFDGPSGEHDGHQQTYEDFRENGPPWSVPQAPLDELQRWIAEHIEVGE